MFHLHFLHISVIVTFCKLITLRYSTLTFFTFYKSSRKYQTLTFYKSEGYVELSFSTKEEWNDQLSLSTKAAENVKVSLFTKAAGNVELSKAAVNVKLSLSTSAVAAATARADTAVWGGELLLVLCHGILGVERDCVLFFDNQTHFGRKIC